ncbi:MAG: hypothetical protein ACK56F_01335, partial [bacterium]
SLRSKRGGANSSKKLLKSQDSNRSRRSAMSARLRRMNRKSFLTSGNYEAKSLRMLKPKREKRPVTAVRT